MLEIIAQREVAPDAVGAEEHAIQENDGDGSQKAKQRLAPSGRSALLAIHASVRIAAAAARPQFSIVSSGA